MRTKFLALVIALAAAISIPAAYEWSQIVTSKRAREQGLRDWTDEYLKEREKEINEALWRKI